MAMTARCEQTGEAHPDADLFQPFVPGIEHRTTGEILAHPGFPRMRRRYVAETIARYEIAAFPGHWQSVVYRVATLGTIVCNDAAYDPADRTTWPTLTRLKEAVAVFGLCGPRQIDDFIARLVETGHVVLEQSAADRRIKLLRSSVTLLAWDREVLASYYTALQMLYPEPGYRAALIRDPDFQRAQRFVSTRYFPEIARFLARNHDLVPFTLMNHGVNVLLLLSDWRIADPGRVIRESDLAALQPRLGISRSHVRNVLIRAEERGLLVRHGSKRKALDVTRRGIAALDLFVADTLASHDMTYRLALRRLSGA
ncbi:hypothetical protein [Methylobacterium variabile]|jgi:hypothetical protein|uniref:hypothetical protein n=1 Tax=Methylobacterium variabile TaxID=298794 RepID=UPI00069D98EF|nr:hypothetical protein [Methylobacterium variabile]